MGLVSRIAKKEAKEKRMVRKKISQREKKEVQEGKYEEDFGRKRLWKKKDFGEEKLEESEKILKGCFGNS